MKNSICLVVILLIAACGESGPPVSATDVVVTSSMPGMKMSAGYLTLTNSSSEDVVVSAITSPQFGSVELHETIIENDVAKMRAIEQLIVPANGQVVFERGGKHLMLMKPTGDSDSVTLNIYSHDTLLLTVTTQQLAR